MTTIIQAVTDQEIEDVRRLMQAFVAWRSGHHRGHLAPVRREWQDQELTWELSELPGSFVPPQGRLLVAYEADQPAGCAAMGDAGDGLCEVTWIFVTGAFRGQRIGRALVERLLLEARSAGYRRMRLGTRVGEDEVMRLCERAGFHRISLDQERPEELKSWSVLFEHDLRLAG